MKWIAMYGKTRLCIQLYIAQKTAVPDGDGCGCLRVNGENPGFSAAAAVRMRDAGRIFSIFTSRLRSSGKVWQKHSPTVSEMEAMWSYLLHMLSSDALSKEIVV